MTDTIAIAYLLTICAVVALAALGMLTVYLLEVLGARLINNNSKNGNHE